MKVRFAVWGFLISLEVTQEVKVYPPTRVLGIRADDLHDRLLARLMHRLHRLSRGKARTP
ncbi:MAG TPA: hypothetical protein VEH27_18615 [Methylomirabilota bacterium]|nr:hypothetical protein [Methylomirabilota bacterium]